MPVLEHLHLYKRSDHGEKAGTYKSTVVYFCAHPDCSHRSEAQFLVGKRAMCGKCLEREFILTKDQLKNRIPVCDFCSRSKAKKDRVERLENIMDELFAAKDEKEEPVA